MILHDAFFTIGAYSLAALCVAAGWIFCWLHYHDQSTTDAELARNLAAITCPVCGGLVLDGGRGHVCQVTYQRPPPFPPPTPPARSQPLALGPGL